MSLLSIPAKIFGFAKSAVKKLPGFKRLRPEKDPDDKVKDIYKAKINSFTQANINEDDMSFDLAPKLRNLIEQVAVENPNIDDGTEEFRQIISEHITPETLDGYQKIKYNETALTDECNTFINRREQDYMRRIDEIKNRQAKNQVVNLGEYDVVFNNFFLESLTLLHNLNNVIFDQIANPENFNSSDLDLAQGFKQTRNLTSGLSTKILNDFLFLETSLKKSLSESLPAQHAGEVEQYFDNIQEQFKREIKILFQSSHFGILDRDFVEAFLLHYLNKIENGKSLNDTDLRVLKEFQEGVHGSLLLTNTLEGAEIASLDLRIIESSIKDLNQHIISLSQTTGQQESSKKRRVELRHKISDIANFIASTGSVERRINERVLAFSKDESANQLGIPRDEVSEIEKEYESIFRIEGFIGRTQDDTINDEKFPPEALLNSFTVHESSSGKKLISPDFAKNYERLVLEASLLAGYHALATHMDKMSDKERQAFFKNKARFANFDKEHIPWLRGFYKKEFLKYKRIIENDPTPRKTANLALQMCALCQRLASPSVDYYQSDDFIKRYELLEIAEAAIQRVGTMTDVNKMSLALKIYSEIFSNLDKDPLAAGLTTEETKWLSRHVEFLKTKAQIVDDKGKPVFDLPEDNPYQQDKFDELSEYFKKTGPVNYNIDLILKYFKNAIEERRNKSRDIKGYSDNDSRNLLLSTALMYYYLKFMPEQSNNVQSLRDREKVIQLFFDPKVRVSKNLPKDLEPKLFDHFFGTESNDQGQTISAANYKREGFLRSYALELEDMLDTYAEGKSFDKIDLPSLLNFYYRLEQLKTRSKHNEHTRYPDNVGKDVSQIKDKYLRMWSKQEKRHILYHNGRNRELLPPLKGKLISLLDKHSSEVLKFINQMPASPLKQEISHDIAKELFKKSAESARKVLAFQANNITEVRDDNDFLLNNLAETFGNLARVANLVQRGTNNNFKLTENSILGEDNRKEYLDNYAVIKSIFDSKFLLVDVENKPGANLRTIKDMVLNLLKAFKIRPEIGSHLDWVSEPRVESHIRELEESGVHSEDSKPTSYRFEDYSNQRRTQRPRKASIAA